jgi:hypothetical protein
LVLAFEVSQAAGNGQAQHRGARRQAQGPNFGVRSHHRNEGVRAVEQIVG